MGLYWNQNLMEHYVMKQTIVIYLATQRIHVVGGGVAGVGGGGEPTIKNLASSHRHCSRLNTIVRDYGPGLFIGQSYWCRLS
jgi:hypothetical protein